MRICCAVGRPELFEEVKVEDEKPEGEEGGGQGVGHAIREIEACISPSKGFMSASLAIVADAPAIAVHGAVVPRRQRVCVERTYVFGTVGHSAFDGLWFRRFGREYPVSQGGV